jgi:hypothetical protein
MLRVGPTGAAVGGTRVATGGTRVGVGGTLVGGTRVGGTRVGGTRVGGTRVAVGTRMGASTPPASSVELPDGSPPSPSGTPVDSLAPAVSAGGGPTCSPGSRIDASGVDATGAASEEAGRVLARTTCHAKAAPTTAVTTWPHVRPPGVARAGLPPKRGTVSHWPDVANCRSRRPTNGEAGRGAPAAGHVSSALPITAGQSARDLPGIRRTPARGLTSASTVAGEGTARHSLPERPGIVATRGARRPSVEPTQSNRADARPTVVSSRSRADGDARSERAGPAAAGQSGRDRAGAHASGHGSMAEPSKAERSRDGLPRLTGGVGRTHPSRSSSTTNGGVRGGRIGCTVSDETSEAPTVRPEDEVREVTDMARESKDTLRRSLAASPRAGCLDDRRA